MIVILCLALYAAQLEERKRIKTFLKFLYCVTQVYVLKNLKEKCFLELQEGIVPACLYSCKNCLTWISLKTENELMCFDLQGGQSCCFFPLCIKFSLNKEKGVGFFLLFESCTLC